MPVLLFSPTISMIRVVISIGRTGHIVAYRKLNDMVTAETALDQHLYW